MNPTTKDRFKPAWAAPNDEGRSGRRSRGAKRVAAPVWGSNPLTDSKLIICAEVPDGVILGHPYWPLMLDGILAWVDRRVMRGIRPRQHDRHVESIPLRKIVPGKAHRSRWFWAASCGIVPDDVPVESRWFGRRTDTTGERARTGKVRNVNASTGADKAVWRARRIVLPGVVAWRAVGDQDEVARWLGEVTHIGDDVRAGNGRVARWEVIRQREEGRDTPITQIEAARWVLGIDPDDTLKFGRLLRPVRPQLGPLFGVEGHETVPGTHRPPYIHPTRTSVGRRDWLDVLAPKPADR